MRRRKAVKAIALSTVAPKVLFGKPSPVPLVSPDPMVGSSWHEWPDVLWTGPDYWGNRLQDWSIRNGKAVCGVSGENRTLHCLTAELSPERDPFETEVNLEWLNRENTSAGSRVGFVFGIKGKFDDYRSAAVSGKGLTAGVNGEGRLFIGDVVGEGIPMLKQTINLVLRAEPKGMKYEVRLSAFEGGRKRASRQVVLRDVAAEDIQGTLALLSHFTQSGDRGDQPSVAFARWQIRGKKVRHHPARAFGPVCFAQYTLNRKTLKLTAQLAPVERVKDHTVVLQVRGNDGWTTVSSGTIDPLGRSVQFRIGDWKYPETMPYRVALQLPLKTGIREFYYEGEIAREPVDAGQVKMAVFSCNCDYGFPDADVPLHVSRHKPDLAVFLGDQFYESTGGFGIQTSPLEKAALDYLRKWYMFGWSYRDIFRNIPAAIIPDDHDVYHGNVWGEGGRKADLSGGWGYPAQDSGGYKMDPEWVNMVQRTQTSHLPDAYDPSPVEQGIGVYFTSWLYAGISMAILEDRKFKSAPRQALPPEARVVNGFIQNPGFDIKAHRDVPATLLGERQLKFLQAWTEDWQGGAVMKAVLSQTNFCTVATLPKGSIIDDMVPRLPIPDAGAYVSGDAPTTDMDSNGWPQKGRDEALKIIRKCFALHIAGDQHLASVVHYGIDEFRDAGFAFAGPALNNLWPRRWWPATEGHTPLPGEPPYTGNFEDGFGNKMTVLAVANPRKTNVEPAIIHDRATGYGIVVFNKAERTMTMECWPRYVDPASDPQSQFKGWPVTIAQKDNYGRRPLAYLPALKIQGTNDPVLRVIHEESGDTEYVLRIKGDTFQPMIFAEGTYTVHLSDPEAGKERVVRGLRPAQPGEPPLHITLR